MYSDRNSFISLIIFLSLLWIGCGIALYATSHKPAPITPGTFTITDAQGITYPNIKDFSQPLGCVNFWDNAQKQKEICGNYKIIQN